jgi:rfaE bifunctional protein kinase chain/domain
MIILESIHLVVILFSSMTQLSHIKKDVTELSKKNILIVGDIMLDEYHWCNVERISPEAPVPVCTVTKTTLVPGGASNVANNITVLDSKAYLSGVIGTDSSGDKLLSVLNDQHISTSFIHQTKRKPTILKSRIIAHQQHIVRVDREDSKSITEEMETALLESITNKFSTFDALLLSDYLKGTLTDSLINKLIYLAKKEHKIIVVDPKGETFEKYRGATILTPNFKEFCTVIKKTPKSEEEILDEGQKIIHDLELEALLVTRSEKGMSLITKNNKTDIPTQAKEVFDITGAGDTVISVLTLALASGWSPEEAAYTANVAAGIVVAKVGTSTASLAEISAKLAL